jgi:YggT family protein
MPVLHFIIDTLIGLYQVVLLLRLLLQITRADFRNPLARAVMQLTNPLIMPLRRVLPAVGRIDTASVVAILLVSVAKVWILTLVSGFGMLLPQALVRGVMLDLVFLVLNTYLFSIVLNAILSFVAPGNYSPAQSLLSAICDPVLNPIRRVIPPIAGLDLSPLWACIAIQALKMTIALM